MSRPHISVAIRRQVSERDKHRCAYCQTQAHVIGTGLEIEHIFPFSKGGLSDEANLCLAYSRCNKCKGSRTVAQDPLSGEYAPLFNPRNDIWIEHFEWGSDNIRIVGKTATGRATIVVLKMNVPIVLIARQGWADAGWHPPRD